MGRTHSAHKRKEMEEDLEGSQEWLCHLSPDLHVDKGILPLSLPLLICDASHLHPWIIPNTCMHPLTFSFSRFQMPLEVGDGSTGGESEHTQVTAGRY